MYLLLLSSVHRHHLKGMAYFLAHLNGCWSFNSLLTVLTGVLFPGNENALPGPKKRKIDKSRDGEIKELQDASPDVTTRCYKATNSKRNGKGLYDYRYVYQSNRENEVVNGYDNHWHKHERYHHERIQCHWHTESYGFIDVKDRGT